MRLLRFAKIGAYDAIVTISELFSMPIIYTASPRAASSEPILPKPCVTAYSPT